MSVLTHTCEGLLFIHCLLLLGFVVGSLILPWKTTDKDATSAIYMARSLIAVTTGLAVIGFTLFALGITFLLTPQGMLISLALLVGISLIAHRRSIFSPQFWSTRIRTFIAAWDLPAIFVYISVIALSVPAVIPNLGSDPAFYHLAYAADWAQAHGITIDPFLRFPFYASNFLLFFTAAISVHMMDFVNFLTWGMSLLTALGILTAIRIANNQNRDNFCISLIACVLTAAVILNPTYLRWNDTGYIDIPIGCFTLMTILSLQLAVKTNEHSCLLSGVLIGAFLVGMKISFFLLFPLLVLEIIIAASFVKIERKHLMAALALFTILSSPWYLRNFIFTGDPIPPVLNLALHGDDGTITPFEWKQLQKDFHRVSTTPTELLTLPARAFIYSSQSTEFREYGTTLLIILLYAPCLWLIFLLAAQNHDGEAWIYASSVTWLVIYWISFSTLLRYSLIFMPALAAAIGILAVRFTNRHLRKTIWWPLIICLPLAIPSVGSQPLYHKFFIENTRDLLTAHTWDPKAYLLKFGIDNAVEQRVVQEWHNRKLHGNVYVLISQEGVYYRLDGVENVGDWIGPGGIFRFYRAVELGCMSRFLEHLNIDGVVILPEIKFQPDIFSMLTEQFHQANYVSVPMPDGNYFFIRSTIRSDFQSQECKDPNWFIPSPYPKETATK